MSALELTTVLICLAALFTYVNVKVLKLPTTIGLMLLACALSALLLLGGLIAPSYVSSAKEVIESINFAEVLLHLMLSFLLFAGALQVNLSVLKKEMWPIILLATTGILLSVTVIGFLLYYLLPLFGYELNLIYCFLFGALISPTDPIAVLALLKKFNISKNLETKIAGESLFNDGVGVVVFMVITSLAFGSGGHSAGSIDTVSVLWLFAEEVLGGLFIGYILGKLGLFLLDRIDNKHVDLEVLITLALVMGGSLIAEKVHASAPLAMVLCGLMLSNQGRKDGKEEATGDYVYKFWHILDETLNAILFILVGLEMVIIPFDFNTVSTIPVIIICVLLGRSVGVVLPFSIISIKRKFDKGTVPTLIWGGLRGGISIALALSLPKFAHKDLFLVMTYGVVLFSIVVQGLSVPKLLGFYERKNAKNAAKP